ncbi:MAG: hypothetical protein JO328_02830 [Hyphomicrobiales bacterium]|nr:hypothetical protein [Hyphomicrobiales bacterium]MBV8825984.1 hypothetical protein [Hyphomicrobiales bacterium]MBV9428529.1 hypothetical protein [Bradyrhizobiaceae bacterium]
MAGSPEERAREAKQAENAAALERFQGAVERFNSAGEELARARAELARRGVVLELCDELHW